MRERERAPLLLSTRDNRPALRPALALAAAADVGDALVLGRSPMRREGSDCAHLMLLLSAVVGAGTGLAAYRAVPTDPDRGCGSRASTNSTSGA